MIKKEDDKQDNVKVCAMYFIRVLAVCLLITVATQSSTSVIADAVKVTQKSVVQVCNDIAASELGTACVHTWQHFQELIAQRPLQAGFAAGVIAFITCYWLSRRNAHYRSMREQSEAYQDGFDDGYSYAYLLYRNNSIWV